MRLFLSHISLRFDLTVCYHVFLIMPVVGAGPGLTEGFNETLGLVLLSETQFVLVKVNIWPILIVHQFIALF